MVTSPAPTDTWSRHRPRAGLVLGAGLSQPVHDHREGLCLDGTVSALGPWTQGAALTVSRAEARPGGPPSENRLWLPAAPGKNFSPMRSRQVGEGGGPHWGWAWGPKCAGQHGLNGAGRLTVGSAGASL